MPFTVISHSSLSCSLAARKKAHNVRDSPPLVGESLSHKEGRYQYLDIDDGLKQYTIPIDRERFSPEYLKQKVEEFNQRKYLVNESYYSLIFAYPNGYPSLLFEIQEYLNGTGRLLTFQQVVNGKIISNQGYMLACYTLDHLDHQERKKFTSTLIDLVLE